MISAGMSMSLFFNSLESLLMGKQAKRHLEVIILSVSRRLLLTTKFFPPPPPARSVKRRDLVSRIEDGLRSQHPLTLISAPAGYGKSALAAEWRESTRRTTTWLALDESDNEPLRFFLYLTAVFQKVDETIGAELMTLLEANQLPPRETLIALLTEDLLASGISLVCVLDDFHSIQDPFILDILQELIAQPQLLQFVIVTREDPAWPLGRLRAHAQLTEIRAADLRFSREETERFFLDVMRIQLSESDLSLLNERAEGWVAGLQLAGLSMQGRDNPAAVIPWLSGSHRHILSYLTEEVLKKQTPSVQDFLLQTSILSKLNADLCNAVTRRSDAAALLEQLLASNLFLIPLDDEGRWYRYHHLFADLLFGILSRTQAEQRKSLHIRAAEWFDSQQMPLDAIDHALAAEDFPRAATLLESHTWTLLNQGYVRRVETWMQALPPEWRAQSPRTNLGFAWMYLLRGNFAQVLPHLQQVETALENTAVTNDLRAECLALKANLMQSQGRISEAIENAGQALTIVPAANVRVLGLAYLGLGAGYRQAVQFDQALDALQQAIRYSRESGDSVTGALATTHLILMSLQHGRLHSAEDISLQMIEQMERSSGAVPPIIGAVYGALGLVYYERNQVERAREHYLRGIQLGTFLGHHASLVYTKLNLARLLQAEGDLDGVAKNLRESMDLIQAGAPGWLRPNWLARQVQYDLATDHLMEAESLLRQSGVTAGQVTHAADEIQLAYVRTMLRRGKEADLKDGIQLAEKVLSLAESGQRNNTSMQALALGALIHEKLGDAKSASAWMERALTLAEPEGYIRLFVDEGAAVASILQRLTKTVYVRALLAAFPAAERPSPKPRPTDGLIEPLSERELEVLRLLAHGLKYAEIAEQLVVSVNTVRFHIKSMYGKLNVDKQAKAIERARELGLVE
jgi:LuxR family transcriptional regulator, maltose regulon positive regulatory protein